MQARATQNKQKAGKSIHAQSCKHIHTKTKQHTYAAVCIRTCQNGGVYTAHDTWACDIGGWPGMQCETGLYQTHDLMI